MPGPTHRQLDVLNGELDAWTLATNADERQVDWQFTTNDARIKLRRRDAHIYVSNQPGD